MPQAPASKPLLTPDRRYIVVRGRLWRATNPALGRSKREALTKELMDARRLVARAQKLGDARLLKKARGMIQQAKVDLGERGPAWWKDGAPDLNRHLIKNTPYAAWYSKQSSPATRLSTSVPVSRPPPPARRTR